MTNCSGKYFFILLLSLLSVTVVQAQLSTETQSNLEEIDSEVKVHDEELKALSLKIQTLEAGRKQTQQAINSIKDREQKLQNELNEMRENIRGLDRALSEDDAKKKRIEEVSLHRLKALYMFHNAPLAESVFRVSDGAALSRNSFFLSKVREFDNNLLAELSVLLREHSKRKDELQKALANRRKVETKIAAERATLEKKDLERAQLVKQLKDEKSREQIVLASLKAKALRIETVVATLTEEDSAKKSDRGKRAKLTKRSESFNGVGLLKQKGSLQWPFEGIITLKFGSRPQTSNFSDIVLSKGLEIRGEVSSPVLSIAEGKVVFAGKLPGYQQVIIIDHGQRNYSLYGRLGEIKITLGDVIMKGEKIATSGSLDGLGSNFYFEIREGAISVNPSKYFSNLNRVRD